MGPRGCGSDGGRPLALAFAPGAAAQGAASSQWADLRWQSGLHAVRGARCDQHEHFGTLEVAWRFSVANLGPTRGPQSEHPARRRRRDVHDGRHAPRGYRTGRRDRRTALGLQPERRAARSRCAAQALGPRPRGFWQKGRRRTGAVWVTPGYQLVAVGRGDRPAGPRLRQEWHRRPARHPRSGPRLGREPRSARTRRRPWSATS